MSIEYTWAIKGVFLENRGWTEPTITEITKEIEIEVPGYPDQVPILDEEGNPTGQFETVENSQIIKKEAVETKIEGSEEVELEKFVQCVDLIYTATKGDLTSSLEITAHLYHNKEGSYVAYEDVTEEKLLSWAMAALEQGCIDNLKNQLKIEIEAQEQTSSGYVTWGNN